MEPINITEIIKDKNIKILEALGFASPKRALSDLLLLTQSPFGQSAELLDKLTTYALESPSPNQALNNLERISKSVPGETLQAALKEKNVTGYLVTLAGSSELLTGSICRHPEILEPLFTGKSPEININKDLKVFATELSERAGALCETSEKNALANTLRIYKQREYVRIGLRDLLNMATLEEVTAEIADLASACLDIAVKNSLDELKLRFGRPLYKDRLRQRT